jgi:hypothetical protein
VSLLEGLEMRRLLSSVSTGDLTAPPVNGAIDPVHFFDLPNYTDDGRFGNVTFPPGNWQSANSTAINVPKFQPGTTLNGTLIPAGAVLVGAEVTYQVSTAQEYMGNYDFVAQKALPTRAPSPLVGEYFDNTSATGQLGVSAPTGVSASSSAMLGLAGGSDPALTALITPIAASEEIKDTQKDGPNPTILGELAVATGTTTGYPGDLTAANLPLSLVNGQTATVNGFNFQVTNQDGSHSGTGAPLTITGAAALAALTGSGNIQFQTNLDASSGDHQVYDTTGLARFTAKIGLNTASRTIAV